MNRRKKLAANLLTAMTLAVSFNAAAEPSSVQEHAPVARAISEAAEPLAEGFSEAAVPYKYSDARMQLIRRRLDESSIGRDLLKFADDRKITMTLSSSKDMGDKDGGDTVTMGLNSIHALQLNGDVGTDDDLALTLVHEIRHSWQSLAAGVDDLRLEPKRYFLLNRFQEADAFAFTAFFALVHERETGKPLRWLPHEPNCGWEIDADCLLQMSRNLHKAGMPDDSIYEFLMTRGFSRMRGLNYDRNMLSHEENTWNDVAKNPAEGKYYAYRLAPLSTEAEFIRTMRRMGAASFDPDNAPNAFANWEDADFLSFEKTGRLTLAELQKLESIETTYKTASARYDSFRKRSAQPKPGV